LMQAQDRLLAAAVEMLAPGGLLVYATCSLQPEEGPERIAALLAGGAPVDRVPVQPEEIGGLSELIDRTGDVRTLPCHLPAHGGLDGFYACRLRRR
jgi:16S rRNA (cytosine967-C5)-methyltransferase